MSAAEPSGKTGPNGGARLGEEIRRDGDLVRALLDVIPNLVFRLDRYGNFHDFLPARGFAPYLPVQEFLGRNLREVFPTFGEEAASKCAEAVATGIEQSLEYDLPVDGEPRYFESRFVPSGATGVLVIVRDVTERRLTAERLRQSEERFRSVVETAGDVILLISPGGEILELNREAERVLGVVREQALGKRFLETFVPESHHEICRSDAAKALGGVPTRGFVYPILRGHTQVRFLSWNLDRMLDSSGGSIGLIACGHDVTDQKVLEESILSIARGVSAATGQKFFRHLVSRLAEILEADFVLIGELERDGAEPARIRTIARFADGKPAKNIVYDLAGSPCENVVGKRLCSYASGVQELFPQDSSIGGDRCRGLRGRAALRFAGPGARHHQRPLPPRDPERAARRIGPSHLRHPCRGRAGTQDGRAGAPGERAAQPAHHRVHARGSRPGGRGRRHPVRQRAGAAFSRSRVRRCHRAIRGEPPREDDDCRGRKRLSASRGPAGEVPRQRYRAAAAGLRRQARRCRRVGYLYRDPAGGAGRQGRRSGGDVRRHQRSKTRGRGEAPPGSSGAACAEARKPRGPRGRNRTRFQQPAHGDPGQREPRPDEASDRFRPRGESRPRRTGGGARGETDQPDARLRGEGELSHRLVRARFAHPGDRPPRAVLGLEEGETRARPRLRASGDRGRSNADSSRW